MSENKSKNELENSNNKSINKNKKINVNKKEKKYKSCIPEEYYNISIPVDKYYYLKKLYNEIYKKCTKAKTNNSIMEIQYNFNEIWKEIKKVEIEIKNINNEKNKIIYDLIKNRRRIPISNKNVKKI